MRVIHLAVDLREAPRNLIHAEVYLPVQPGPTATFTTPVWIQELHAPAGPAARVAGLRFFSEDRVLRWQRDPINNAEYHVDIPAGVDTVLVVFDAVITWKVTRRMVRLGWEHVLIYPAHRDLEKTAVRAAVTVPRSWGVATALENLGRPVVSYTPDGEGKRLLYHTTSVLRLADSPVLTGLHLAEYPLTVDGRHILCVAADTEDSAVVPQETLDKISRMVAQTLAVFGLGHYEIFRFLLALSDYGEGYFYGGTNITTPSRQGCRGAGWRTRLSWTTRGIWSRTSSYTRGAASFAGPPATRHAISRRRLMGG